MAKREIREWTCIAASIVSLLLCGPQLNATEDPPTGSFEGVEEFIDVPCAGGNHEVEVSPSTSRVRVSVGNYSTCECFWSAEQAVAWLKGYAEAAVREGGVILARIPKIDMKGDPVSSSEPTVVTKYCYTVTQIHDYVAALLPQRQEASGQ